MRGKDGDRIWKYKIAMRDTAFSASKRIMSMLAVRGDERAAKVMYNLVINRPLAIALKKTDRNKEGIEILKLAVKAGITEESLIGEYSTSKPLPWSFIHTYTAHDYLVRYFEKIKERAHSSLADLRSLYMPDEKVETLTSSGEQLAARAGDMCGPEFIDGRLLGHAPEEVEEETCYEEDFEQSEMIDDPPTKPRRSLPVVSV